MNISEILGLADDTWVDEFDAAVKSAVPKKAKNGTIYFQCILVDPQFPSVEISTTFFGRDCTHFAGKVLHFSGKGMKKGSYNRTAQLTVFDKATVQVVGNSTIPVENPNTAAKGRSKAGGNVNFHNNMKCMSLYNCHCVDYAHMINEKAYGGQMTPEQFQSTVASLFIEGNKQGIAKHAPAREAQTGPANAEPVQQAQPTPQPQAEMPVFTEAAEAEETDVPF